ncbi:MAG: methyltransferase domain-containing protein [Chloroflexota bacterium]|nr:methyltransferase domain-containing protein [Chloroflexota bacterium]
MAPPDSHPPICDYEGSTYRTDFWEGRGRDYEDRAERIALRKLLPPRGRRLLELGAGFGRLTGEYAGYDQVILLDYSRTQLKQAQEYLGKSDRYIYVAADVYHMPFRASAFDAVTMVRVLHHIAQIEEAIAEIQRIIAPGGSFILEHASKRHLKSMVRYWLRQQTWNPFDPAPIEFVELNFDFHPDHVQRALRGAGFSVKRRLPVSLLRIPTLKEHIPVGVLAGIDGLFQETGLLVTPSVFVQAKVPGAPSPVVPAADLFACPRCGGNLRPDAEGNLVCENDGLRWQVRDGIYDFKAPIDED